MSEEEKIPQGEAMDNSPQSTEEKLHPVADVELQTTNPKIQTQQMEVHHHGHVHEKKKWKEYLFQFLMLFLAVFCGFLAEYQLEQTIERHREKDYIRSFTQDLKTDTLSLSEWINIIQDYKTKIDSLIYLLSQPDLHSYGNNLYYYARFTTRQNFFKSNNRTIAQLKNSGGLRLIKNQQASDSIMSYQQELEDLETNRGIAEKETQFLYPYLSRIFDPAVFEAMTVNLGEIKRPTNNPSLRNINQDQIKEFIFYLHQKKASYIFTVYFLKNLHIKAGHILAFLKKEYHLQ